MGVLVGVETYDLDKTADAHLDRKSSPMLRSNRKPFTRSTHLAVSVSPYLQALHTTEIPAPSQHLSIIPVPTVNSEPALQSNIPMERDGKRYSGPLGHMDKALIWGFDKPSVVWPRLLGRKIA